MDIDIRVGNCLDILPTLPANSVHCVVTSPPYFGLRDYGTAQWEGGDAGCDHRVSSGGPSQLEGASQRGRSDVAKGDCPRCGARRVDNQIGLEDSPAAYVARMVDVFAEVRRVLRDDGTVWLNIGDSFAGSGTDGLKPKDLMMIPARVAIALQDAGWWLRSEITWAKRAPMPESVVDRPTSATEKIFLLTKSARYYYDAEAVKEASEHADHYAKYALMPSKTVKGNGDRNDNGGNGTHCGFATPTTTSRNMRNFWLLSPEPYKGSHFATFPTEIPRRAILAGTSARGACPECGAPWRRVVEKPDMSQRPTRGNSAKYPTNGNQFSDDGGGTLKSAGQAYQEWRNANPDVTTGWQPTCTCGHTDTVPCTVLDPFLGSGTTLAVTQTLGRSGIGIELNPHYAELARQRIGKAQPALLALDSLQLEAHA